MLKRLSSSGENAGHERLIYSPSEGKLHKLFSHTHSPFITNGTSERNRVFAATSHLGTANAS
jgi:hypothetical protein